MEESREEEVEPKGAEEKSKGDRVEVKREDKGKPAPGSVIGESLVATVNISVKTLALYQIAASMQNDELTLGDFIDTCVEDTYRGRGLDLGLINLRGKNDYKKIGYIGWGSEVIIPESPLVISIGKR